MRMKVNTTHIEATIDEDFGTGARARRSDASPARWLVPGGLALVAACGSTTPSGGTPDAGSSGAGATLSFQPSNVSLAEIAAVTAQAQAENESGACSIQTDAASPAQDCFSSPIEAVTQPDGSTVNLVVVQSLAVQSTGVITVTGGVPLVLVSLSDATLFGAIVASSAGLSVGPGGAGPAASNANGMGGGGGAAGSGSADVGGSGGSYCGLGGLGGGQTAVGLAYGNAAVRPPLVGGSAGGGGTVGSGAGGGAIQITAADTLTLNSGGSITVGGQGGPISGLASDQNAGGGGSGGAILLEATAVTVAGTLAANGGGGGGDYSGNGGADATADATPAAGGTASGSGAAGGNGGAASTINGSPGQSVAMTNSGGGGGGTGRIRLNSAGGTATVSGILSPSAGHILHDAGRPADRCRRSSDHDRTGPLRCRRRVTSSSVTGRRIASLPQRTLLVAPGRLGRAGRRARPRATRSGRHGTTRPPARPGRRVAVAGDNQRPCRDDPELFGREVHVGRVAGEVRGEAPEPRDVSSP